MLIHKVSVFMRSNTITVRVDNSDWQMKLVLVVMNKNLLSISFHFHHNVQEIHIG